MRGDKGGRGGIGRGLGDGLISSIRGRGGRGGGRGRFIPIDEVFAYIINRESRQINLRPTHAQSEPVYRAQPSAAMSKQVDPLLESSDSSSDEEEKEESLVNDMKDKVHIRLARRISSQATDPDFVQHRFDHSVS